MVKPREPRSLLPHEHGAYGQLAMPLACALLLGRPGVAAWLLSLGAFAGFLSYEPLLVAAGRRGARAREEHGARAARLAAGILAGAVALAGTGLVLATPAARLASVVPPLLAAGIALLVRLGVERTVAGEVAVAIALSSAAFPVAVAAGVPAAASAQAWLAWAIGFTAATLAVEVVLTRARLAARGPGAGDPGLPAAGAVLLLLGGAIALAAAGLVPWAVPGGAAPLALSSLAVIGLRVPARRLKAVGWAAVLGSAGTLAVLVATLR